MYLLSADAIFDTIIPVTDESRIQGLPISNDTGDIIYSIDSVRIENLAWKEVISIKGWAYDNQSEDKNTEIFILLDSGKSNESFNTFKHKRPDVSAFYNNISREDLADSGFYANIPIYHLHEGRNRIFFVLKNTRGTSFVRTNQYITKINDHIFPGFLSEEQKFDFNDSIRNITFKIEEIKTTTTISIKAWAFINDQDASKIEKYVLLESENSSYIFDTASAKRPDVTSIYKYLNINLDDSGLYGNIPISAISDGKYRIGIILKSNNDTRFVRSKEFITKKNDQVIYPRQRKPS